MAHLLALSREAYLLALSREARSEAGRRHSHGNPRSAARAPAHKTEARQASAAAIYKARRRWRIEATLRRGALTV